MTRTARMISALALATLLYASAAIATLSQAAHMIA
jgi:hypothetical protein